MGGWKIRLLKESLDVFRIRRLKGLCKLLQTCAVVCQLSKLTQASACADALPNRSVAQCYLESLSPFFSFFSFVFLIIFYSTC